MTYQGKELQDFPAGKLTVFLHKNTSLHQSSYLFILLTENRRKICILSVMEKDPKVISCSEQHIVHVTT